MKKFILLFLLFAILSCQEKPTSEKKESNSKDLNLPPPPRAIDENNLIGFACYMAGERSEVVKNFSTLLKQKNYRILREKLTSTFPAEKYMATVLCEKLVFKHLLKITEQELIQIQNNKLSSDTLTICSGCTNEDDLTLKEMFSPSKNYLSAQFNEWFKQAIE